MDEKLKPTNGRLQTTFAYIRPRAEGEKATLACYPLIGVEKLETRSRARPALAVPSFCPFCGKPYHPEEST